MADQSVRDLVEGTLRLFYEAQMRVARARQVRAESRRVREELG